MMVCDKRGKKRMKHKWKRRINGSISILLCLLLTPFLSIALGLVEYARYQQVIEITDEVFEMTDISTLSDYDSYIHKRFGLLATSQETELGSGVESLLQDNIKILGKQVTLSNTNITGDFSLANTEVLRRQVVDFSELSATTAVLAEDFKLEELLEKLQGVSQFQDIMNTVNSLSDLADALSDAVDALETLETSVTNLQNDVNTAIAKANTLSEKMADLYKKLGDNGVTLPREATIEEIETAINTFCDSYLDDFKALYTTGNDFITSVKEIKTELDNVKTAVSGFVAAVNKAKQATENITAGNSVDDDGSISEAANKTMEDILNEMEELVNNTISSIKEESINTAKETLNTIINITLESSGLAGITERYTQIINGTYFNRPLSDLAKQDLKDLLMTVYEVYSSHGDASALTQFFKDRFQPNISINTSEIITQIQGTLSEATNTLKDKVQNGLISLLTNLVNIVKSLFDLDLFYEEDLNAFVNIGSASSSPYQSFLDALGNMFTAIEDFKNAIADSGIISKLTGILKSIGKLFKSIGELIGAIVSIAGEAIQSIAELGSSIISGDVKGLYEKFLISGYMRHNLPCRLNASDWETGSNATIKVSLEGKGLTGFSYNDIARCPTYIGQSDASSGFLGMANVISNLKNGFGSDKTFKGAELEYIRAGTNSEIANQVIVFFDLYFLRLLLDLPTIFTNEEVNTVAAAATIASWVVYILYILIEPFCDTLLLVNGENVPLIRSNCWLTASGVGDFISKMGDAVLGGPLKESLNSYTSTYTTGGGSGSSSEGLSYQTYVLILLLIFVPTDTQINRLKNVIDLETAEHYRQLGKENFSMLKTYTAIKISSDVVFNPFFDLGMASGGSPLEIKGKIKQTVCY